MQLETIAPGLARWSASHPAWEAGADPDSPADWPEAVGSVAAEVAGTVVLIDPLVPEELWPALDAFVAGRPAAVLQTIRWHGRSRDAVIERYGGTDTVPDGVEPIAVPDETMYWLPGHAALVPGDRLIGDGAGGLRMCPPSWLRYIDPPVSEAQLREVLRERLLSLPAERVLVSHGEPVLSGGAAAIAGALA